MKSSWKVLTFVICLLNVNCGDSNSTDNGSGGAAATTAVGSQGVGGTVASNNAGTSTTSAVSGKSGSTAIVSNAGKTGASGTKPKGAGAGGKAKAKGGAGGAKTGSGGGGAGAPQDNTPSDGTLPPVDDVWATGPFTLATKTGAGPTSNATVFYPRELGENGIKHPVVTWGNGAGQYGTSFYRAITTHVATHGFVVYTSYGSTDQGTELKEGLDWMIAENDRNGSEFYQKLDTTRTASMGHSQGSIATFNFSSDPRLTTTIHLSGGTNPDIANGHESLPGLHAPVMFICGENIPGGDGLMVGDTASEWCQYDFENVKVPVWFAVITGASHITAPGQTSGALVAWLRWRLTGDTNIKKQFVGDNCELCSRRGWVVQQRGLEK